MTVKRKYSTYGALNSFKSRPYSFEQVEKFKFLEVNISTKNNMYNEIQLGISTANNKTYLAINKMLSSRQLSKAIKEKLYTSYL